VDEELAAIREEVGGLVRRLDDLVYDALRRTLHGEDRKALERRLARARNGLRRVEGLLGPTDGDVDDLDDGE
jgi:hypothetical protein